MFIIPQKRKIVYDIAMEGESFASLFEAVAERFPSTNDIAVTDPLYWVPNDTSNNLYPEFMKLFYGFKSTLVDPL